MLLKDKTAVITGAGRGIGRSIAEVLASEGARIAVCEISSELGEETCSIIKNKGGEACSFGVDVRNAVAVQNVIDKIIDKYGGIDILVNNAGVTRDNLILRMKDEDWDFVLDTNLKGTFYFTRSVLKPMMKNRSGAIINVASVIGITGNAGQSNYSASKAGVIGLTKSTAKEVASRGIRVNAVAPGFIETDMTRKLDETVREKIMEKIPLGVMGMPEDVANTVLFLASDKAKYVTGQVIVIDGGMVM
ncbi:MAG: 3-oxoacyl-[acyl-carrier-protein] reductase [Candidatus Aureabacteria bacterium]|nr:3-oxoacyl-[acyl-carrier-protein] reductase [Candidatus Auribacterota bacterium]